MENAGSNNRLVNALPRQQRDRLMSACQPCKLIFDDMLAEAGELYQHAYFPDSGQISLVSSVHGHRPLEMGLIGHESMLGTTLVLGIGAAPMRAIVQGPGTALRIPVARLRHELLKSPALRRILNQHLYLQLIELSLAGACTRFHNIEQRLARWLLLTHDRAQSDRFHLTHAYLADMLGVRRSGITVAAGNLQAREIIHYSRGDITVLDRRGLEAASCGCYATLRDRSARVRGALARK